MLHLLRHGTSVQTVSSEGPVPTPYSGIQTHHVNITVSLQRCTAPTGDLTLEVIHRLIVCGYIAEYILELLTVFVFHRLERPIPLH
jgi:hypothetical protein